MNNFNDVIEDLFKTFRTDIPGIRVKKFLKLVRTVQATIPDLEKSKTKSVQVYENGHSILVSSKDDHWQVKIDQATVYLDDQHIYDNQGNISTGAFIAPAVIKTILAA